MATVPVSASQRALAAGMFVGVFAAAFETIAVATAMPAAAAELGRIELYAWTFSLFVIGALIATVAGGRWSDRVGPVPTITAGAALFVTGLVVAGLAPTMEVLLAGRLIQGLGAGAFNVSLYVLVAHAFDEGSRPRMMTVISAAWVVPAFIGPPVAGWVSTRFSWHWVFLGVIPIVLLAIALSLRALIDFARTHRVDRSADTNPAPVWIGAAFGLAAVCLQFAGQRAGEPHGRDWLTAVAAVAGIALLAVAVPRLMPKGYLTFGRDLAAVMATRALVPGAFFAAEAFIPLMLVHTRGLALAEAGILLTVGAVSWFFGSWLQAQRRPSQRRDRLIQAGALSVAVGIAGCALLAVLPGLPVWVGAVIWAVSGFGMGLVVASTGLAVMTLTDSAQQGRNASALQTSEALGTSIITGLAGTLFAGLRTTGDLQLTFGVLLWSMVLIAGWGTVRSLRITLPRTPAS